MTELFDEGYFLGGLGGIIFENESRKNDIKDDSPDFLDDEPKETPEEESKPFILPKEKGVNRPKTWNDFIGVSNKGVIERLKIACMAAKKQDTILSHILLYGSGGLGKTTLAKIIAGEMQYVLQEVTGSAITKQTDIFQILYDICRLQYVEKKKVILFIDEIHDIAARDAPETLWYPFLESFTFFHNLKNSNINLDGNKFDILDSVMTLEPLTVIGATTDPAMLSQPFRDRFPIAGGLKQYTDSDLQQILVKYAERIKVNISTESALSIAQRSRGVPRVAINFLTSCNNRAIVQDINIDTTTVLAEMDCQGIDSEGLNADDILVLKALLEAEKGLGLTNLAGTCGLNKLTLETIVEPLLKQRGYIKVTNKRHITVKGIEILKQKGVS